MKVVAGIAALSEGTADAAAEHESSDPEAELLLRHRTGDPAAFPRLVAAYRSTVYSYLVRCGVCEADRDDLFQDVFLRIHEAADSYRVELPLHPWLFTIVANAVRTHLRRARVRLLVCGGVDDEIDPPANDPGVERTWAAKQDLTWLEEQIRRLPLSQREVLILSAVENLPQQEVARALGIPVNTVKTHLRRARLALARRLARRDAASRGDSR